MRKGRDGEKRGEKNGEKKKKKYGWKLWPLHHCQQSTARTLTAGTSHARANVLITRTLAESGKRWQCFLLTARNAAPPETTHRLLNPKRSTGCGKRCNPMLLDPLISFRKISFWFHYLRTSKIQNSCQGDPKMCTYKCVFHLSICPSFCGSVQQPLLAFGEVLRIVGGMGTF